MICIGAPPMRIIIACLLLILCCGAHSAPVSAQSPTLIFDNYRQSIVKITVTGRDPEGRSKSAVEGSGSIIYSGKFTLILTAEHLLGSSSIDSQSNRDWQIVNGRVDRKIRIESLDERGRLLLVNPDATVFPVRFPSGIDVAVLSVPQRGFPKVTMPATPPAFETTFNVMLMGFMAQQSDLSMPFQMGRGVARASGEFVTNQPSRPGESGGAWVDGDTGILLAVASGQRNNPANPIFVATPVALVLDQIRSYLDNVAGGPVPTVVVTPPPPLGTIGKCNEVAFTDYSKMPPLFSKRVVCN